MSLLALTTTAHESPHGTGGIGALLSLSVIGLVVCAYVLLAARRHREPRGWQTWRTVSFGLGCALLAVAALGLSPFPAGDFRAHMQQHVVIGMLAPLALVLGAPITLLLRSLPRRQARRLGRLLRSRPLHLIGHPVSALTLSLGGLAVLYCTPLYAATTTSPGLHLLVHVHVFGAGYLFAWAIAGPDPAPRRPAVRTRLVVLGVAITAHAVLSQLMYAGLLTQLPVPTDQLRGAGEIMYYGGDIAELLLALALLTTWRPRPSVASPASTSGARHPGRDSQVPGLVAASRLSGADPGAGP